MAGLHQRLDNDLVQQNKTHLNHLVITLKHNYKM